MSKICIKQNYLNYKGKTVGVLLETRMHSHLGLPGGVRVAHRFRVFPFCDLSSFSGFYPVFPVSRSPLLTTSSVFSIVYIIVCDVIHRKKNNLHLFDNLLSEICNFGDWCFLWTRIALNMYNDITCPLKEHSSCSCHHMCLVNYILKINNGLFMLVLFKGLVSCLHCIFNKRCMSCK